jgi:hypothetical protein
MWPLTENGRTGRAPDDDGQDDHAPADHPSGDSAGQPWKGRHFQSHGFESDDGAAPEALVEAIRRFRAGEMGQAEVVDALRPVRLLVPLVAHAGDVGETDDGRPVDKTQELSLVTVAGPGGRTVLPAFTSVETMAVWNPSARPIPVGARRAALAAAAEGTELIVLDPGSATEFVVRRPAVWAIAQDTPWRPAVEDPDVARVFEASVAVEPDVVSLALAPGDPDARLRGSEAVVVLALRPGLDQSALAALIARVQDAWSREPVIAERIDSLGVRILATPADGGAA